MLVRSSLPVLAKRVLLKSLESRLWRRCVAPSRPEFLNRIDDVVVFQPLGLEDIERIVDIQLKDVRSRLANERMTLELEAASSHWL